MGTVSVVKRVSAAAGVAGLAVGGLAVVGAPPAGASLLATGCTVVGSGVVEIALGAAFVVLPRRRRLVGGLLAAFFVVIFPGNVAQYVEGVDAFGLDTDTARFVRLFFQPVLIAIALWSTGGWAWLRERVRR